MIFIFLPAETIPVHYIESAIPSFNFFFFSDFFYYIACLVIIIFQPLPLIETESEHFEFPFQKVKCMISPTSVTRDITLAMLLYLSCSTVKLEKADNWSGGSLTFMSRNQITRADSHMVTTGPQIRVHS